MTSWTKYVLFLSMMTVTALSARAVSASADTSVTDILKTRLDEYIAAISFEDEKTKCAESDFLIETCTDTALRRFTALYLYDHWIQSKLMGDEAVAIHLTDKWFASGKIRMRDETELMTARMFAEFNRQSLIGRPAPELTMEDIGGNFISVFGNGESSDRMTVLFFYDSDCPKCRMESILLRNVLDNSKCRIRFLAIYTSQDKKRWKDFVDSHFKIDNPDIETLHLSDPDMESDFQRKYGVLQTPAMFLVSPEGIILGRKLDAAALASLIDTYGKAYGPYEYGNDESADFFSKMFAAYGEHPDCAQVRDVCDRFSRMSLENRDTSLFRHLTGDLMYWLAVQRGEGYRCGLGYLIDTFVKDRPDIWNSGDDSLKVISYAEILEDLLARAPEGGRLPEIKVSGTMKHDGKEKKCSKRLDRLVNTTVIVYTEGCEYCRKEIEKAAELSASGTGKYFLIDLDRLMNEDSGKAATLLDKLDLTLLPYITVTDGKGLILRKYVSLSASSQP